MLEVSSVAVVLAAAEVRGAFGSRALGEMLCDAIREFPTKKRKSGGGPNRVPQD